MSRKKIQVLRLLWVKNKEVAKKEVPVHVLRFFRIKLFTLGAQIKYKIMQPTMHTPVPLALSYICPFNSESEDIKERFDNDIRESITDVQ